MFGGICYGCAGLGNYFYSNRTSNFAPASREAAMPCIHWQPDEIRALLLDATLHDPELTLPHMAIVGPAFVPLFIELVVSQHKR